MSYQLLKPSAHLAPYIRMYWSMESSLKPGEKHVQRIVPNGFSEIIFYEKDVPESTSQQGYLQSRTQVSGQKNNYSDLIVSGHTRLFSVVFEPYGISQFFNIPVSELMNQTIPLRFLLGPKLDEPENKIFEANSVHEKIAIIEKFFLQLLSENHHLPRISRSVRELNSSSGNVQVPDLASNAYLSRKQFERKFTDMVGISPKQFMRVVRFQRALFIRQNNPLISLTQLAYDAGYYDQPHMIADFKQLSGLTPGQYFAQCEPFSDYFSPL